MQNNQMLSVNNKEYICIIEMNNETRKKCIIFFILENYK